MNWSLNVSFKFEDCFLVQKFDTKLSLKRKFQLEIEVLPKKDKNLWKHLLFTSIRCPGIWNPHWLYVQKSIFEYYFYTLMENVR